MRKLVLLLAVLIASFAGFLGGYVWATAKVRTPEMRVLAVNEGTQQQQQHQQHQHQHQYQHQHQQSEFSLSEEKRQQQQQQQQQRATATATATATAPITTLVGAGSQVGALQAPPALNILTGKKYSHHPVMLQLDLDVYAFEKDFITEWNGLKIPSHYDCDIFNNNSHWGNHYYFMEVPTRWYACHLHDAAIKSGLTFEQPLLPFVDDEYQEQVAMYHSVLRAAHVSQTMPQMPFVVAELGPRWGTWGTRAVAFWKKKRPGMPYSLYFAESFQKSCDAIKTVCDKNDIRYELFCGNADASNFKKWAEQVHHIDVIDMDIQGAEDHLVTQVMDVLEAKAYRLVIGTHTPAIHTKLSQLFRQKQWHVVVDVPMNPKTECVNTYLRGEYKHPQSPHRFDWKSLLAEKCYTDSDRGPVANWDGELVVDNPRFVKAGFSMADNDLRIDDLKQAEIDALPRALPEQQQLPSSPPSVSGALQAPPALNILTGKKYSQPAIDALPSIALAAPAEPTGRPLVVGVSFAQGEVFERSGESIQQIILESKFADEFVFWKKEDIMAAHPENADAWNFPGQRPGCMSQKSTMILDQFESHPEGTWVFWIDSSQYFKGKIQTSVIRFTEVLDRMNLTALPGVPVCRMLNSDSGLVDNKVHEALQLTGDEYRKSSHYQDNFVAFKNTPENRAFITEWKQYNLDMDVAKASHTEDQAIFSLLVSKYQKQKNLLPAFHICPAKYDYKLSCAAIKDSDVIRRKVIEAYDKGSPLPVYYREEFQALWRSKGWPGGGETESKNHQWDDTTPPPPQPPRLQSK